MLAGDLYIGALKRALSRQPFIDDDPQRILVAGEVGASLELFRGHIGDSPYNLLALLRGRTLDDQRDAKVAEQNLVVFADQHILRFHIAMDQILIMRVL